MRGHRPVFTQLLLLSLGFTLLVGGAPPVFSQQAQDLSGPLNAIQQDIIALRNEFKLWIQKAERDQETIQQHIGAKLDELLAQTKDSASAYPERLKKATQLQSAIDSYSPGINNLEQTVEAIEATMAGHLAQIELTLAKIKVYGVFTQQTAAEPGGLPVPEVTEVPETQEDVPILEIPPGQLFRAAYRFYMDGDYDTAIAGFQKYLIDYPGTQLAGAAQYWIAESLAKVEEYDIALEEYDRLITQYAQNDKLPDAYYGKASVLLKLGQTDEARSLLQYVIDHFRGTIAARKAENRLQDLQ